MPNRGLRDAGRLREGFRMLYDSDTSIDLGIPQMSEEHEEHLRYGIHVGPSPNHALPDPREASFVREVMKYIRTRKERELPYDSLICEALLQDGDVAQMRVNPDGVLGSLVQDTTKKTSKH